MSVSATLSVEPGEVFALLENTRDPDKPAHLYTRPAGQVIAAGAAGLRPALAQLSEGRGLHAVGYIAFEAGYVLQGLPLPAGAANRPLLHFQRFAERREIPAAEVDGLLAAMAGPAPCAIHDAGLAEDEAAYAARIAAIHDLITEGDTYQVNYTLPWRFRHAGNAAALYRALRRTQRVEYAAFLNFPETRVLSLSPELFLRREGTLLTARPMKGTAPRGAAPDEDQAIAWALRMDAKSRAENLMIVDLLRNDIGSIAVTGSVRVPALFAVETYETLHQMTSTITGELPAGAGFADICARLFPCGSVTGAPKRRTMEIIAALEGETRGIYTGALGWIAPDGDFCLNVPIRTVVSETPGVAQMGVGSGIVHESSASGEYAEVLLKTRFLAGTNRGFSLIESMRWDADGIHSLDLHLERLAASAATFGFPCDTDALRAALVRHTRSKAPEGLRRLRLSLDHAGGVEIGDYAAATVPDASALLALSSVAVDADSVFRRHKTTHRECYEAEYARALAAGCYEALFLNQHGRVAEAARHNVFIRAADGILLTPPVREGALPGILRRQLLESGAAREAEISLAELRDAEAIYVGNAVRGLQHVTLERRDRA